MASPLLVFADDWGRHPSSCQHLVRHLLEERQVLWVNTIGTRTPRLNRATLTRGFEKLRHWFDRSKAASTALHPHLGVANPTMWPWFGSQFARSFNRRLVERHLRPLIGNLPSPPIAVTTLPIVCDLVGALPVKRWVYYCVDDFSLWPGLDHKTLLRMDEELIRKADCLVAVSANLQERLRRLGRSSQLLTHGVDLDFWRRSEGLVHPVPWAGCEKPLIAFWGVVDRRMDRSVLHRLGKDLTKGTIVLVGPLADPDPELLSNPRIAYFPPVPFGSLPILGHDASVLIMPYGNLPVTQAIQPLKLKEYLATGKPVVVADLPANREWADCADLAATPEQFSEAVRLRLEKGIPADQQSARGRLSQETWDKKARLFAQWIEQPASAPAITAVSHGARSL